MASPKEAEVPVSESLGRAAAVPLRKNGAHLRPELASPAWELAASVAASRKARGREGTPEQTFQYPLQEVWVPFIQVTAVLRCCVLSCDAHL